MSVASEGEKGSGGYVVVTGVGRSGSNWLLDIFDLSPVTFCRNEPEARAGTGTPFQTLPSQWVDRGESPELERLWDEVAEWTIDHIGPRDHPRTRGKVYYRPAARLLWLDRLVYGGRLRRWASALVPSLRQWHIRRPRWLIDERRFRERALPVLKIITAPAWAAWALRHRPSVRVIHIVRHPGGFLNSYLTRYVDRKRPVSTVIEESRRRLRELVEAGPAWAERVDDIDSMSLEELEMWFWRYAAETLHEAGQGRTNYRCVRYEDLVDDAAGQARRLYEWCGLEWAPDVERRVRRMNEASRRISQAWREKLTAEQVAIIERVMEGSPLASWWPDLAGGAPVVQQGMASEGS